MSVVASRPSESPRMPYNNLPYRDVTPPPPHHQQQPQYRQASRPYYPRHASPGPARSPTFPPPRSSSHPSYMNHHTSSSASYIPSSTAVRCSFLPVKPGQLNPLEQQQQPPLEVFHKRFPDEVYECILTHLQALHTSSCAEGCLTCFMRDLYSLSLTSRAWEKGVRGKLYNKIYLHGNDSPAQLKKYKWKRGSRLRLLRRTLRERKSLANAVFELKIPELDALSTLATTPGKQNNVLQDYRDLIASVVMVCPNLERLVGIALPYHHEFDRLTHALSTRKNLKEHAWIVGENAEAAERSRTQSTDILDNNQVFQFLNYHTSWSKLETLMLHSLEGRGILEHGVFLRMLNFLPSLRHLSISCFDADDFTDRSLLFLPALTSLRLEGLQGVTENGLARYTSTPEARGLKSLTIIEQNISSLLVFSKIFASLPYLERFSIVQTNMAPSLPEGGMVFQPILASATLKFLHWDVASPNPANALNQLDHPFAKPLKAVNTPNSHLAQSILHDGFPVLDQLRAPLDIDPLGAIQAVCRPSRYGQIMVPADRYSLPRSSHGSLPKRPLAMPAGNNLSSARIRAQTLIDLSYKDNDTGMKVLITDHSADPVSIPTFATASGMFSNSSDSGSSSESIEDIHNILGPLKENEHENKNNNNLSLSSPPPPPLKVHEFIIPACIGRVYSSAHNKDLPKTPRFTLIPDIPSSDTDGGLTSWKHVLTTNQTLAYSPYPSQQSSITSPSTGTSTSMPFGRVNTNSSMSDEISSPSTTTSSRFSMWGSGSNSSSISSMKSGGGTQPSPRTPTSPTKAMWMSSNSDQPFFAKDTCNGSWNQGHKLGKEWWSHVERERVGGSKPATAQSFVTPTQLF